MLPANVNKGSAPGLLTVFKVRTVLGKIELWGEPSESKHFPDISWVKEKAYLNNMWTMYPMQSTMQPEYELS